MNISEIVHSYFCTRCDLSNEKVGKRKVRNYILQPLLQVRLGVYCVVLSSVYLALVYYIMLINFGSLIESIIELTNAGPQVHQIVGTYWSKTQLWIYFASALYALCVVVVSVWFTHKLIGPTVAFRRHLVNLAKGNYDAKTHLRKGDAFNEVAEALNHLSDTMKKNFGGSK